MYLHMLLRGDTFGYARKSLILVHFNTEKNPLWYFNRMLSKAHHYHHYSVITLLITHHTHTHTFHSNRRARLE